MDIQCQTVRKAVCHPVQPSPRCCGGLARRYAFGMPREMYTIGDHYPQWKINGTWPCGHMATIDLGRFMAWGMADVPLMALCTRLRCPECDGKGPAKISAGWVGRNESLTGRIVTERAAKVRQIKPKG
jgi:hypothetical protein